MHVFNYTIESRPLGIVIGDSGPDASRPCSSRTKRGCSWVMDVSKWIGRLLYQIKYLVHSCTKRTTNAVKTGDADKAQR